MARPASASRLMVTALTEAHSSWSITFAEHDG